jgi:hypothetical protein
MYDTIVGSMSKKSGQLKLSNKVYRPEKSLHLLVKNPGTSLHN